MISVYIIVWPKETSKFAGMYVQSGSFRKKKAAVAIIVAKCVSNGWRRVQSDPDLWRHIIFFSSYRNKLSL